MPIASAFRSALLVFVVALSVVVSPALLAQGSTAADGFNPNVDGNVNALARQSDGKILIAGNFAQLQPNGAAQPTDKGKYHNIARVLADGRLDTSFASSTSIDVNGQINAVVVQSDGKIVIGGKFTAINGQTHMRVARLNSDGTLDATYNPAFEGGLTPDVMALALQADGKIVVGGGFNSVNGTTRNAIARLNADGGLDDSFNPNANGMVLALAVDATQRVLMGGGFTTVQGVARKRIARVSSAGVVDGFDPSANNAVLAIEVLANGNIVFGGTFTTLTPNGSADPVTSGAIRIAQVDPNGTLSAGFIGNIDGQVNTIKQQSDGRILVGGLFVSVSGTARSYFARIAPTGTIDVNFGPSPNYAVNAILVQPNGSIVIGGAFSTLRASGVTSVVRNHVARVASAGSLDNDFRPDMNGRLRSLFVQSDGRIIAGGSFTSIAGQSRSGLVRLNANGTVDTTFNASVNGGVAVVVQQSDKKLVIAGAFTRVNGTLRSYLARLNEDGSLDEEFNPSPNAQINAMLLQASGKILIGGAFTSLTPASTSEPVARNYIARINTNGTLDTDFTVQVGDAVWAIANQPDGKLVVGGAFSMVIGTGDKTTTARSSIARFDVDGKLDTGFNPTVNGTVFAVAVQSDSKVIIGGSFSQLAPNGATTATDRNRIARLNADGTLDTNFTTSVNDIVIALAVQPSDQKILIAGGFSAVQGTGATEAVERNYVARLNTNGSLDDSYNLYLDVTPGNQVVALGLAGTKHLIGGAFSQIGSSRVNRSRIALINSDGTPDPGFNADLAANGAEISAITLQTGGQILAAGAFSTMNGTGSSNLARFYGDGMPDVNFVPTINGPVYAIAETPIKGSAIATQKTGFAWLEGNGQLRSTFKIASAVTSMSSVTAAAVQPDGKVLLGATFNILNSAGGTDTTTLARFNPDGSLDPSFALKATGTINVIKVLSDGKILIGGTFSKVGDTDRNNIARLNSDGTLDTSFAVATDGGVYTIGFQSDGKLVLGGTFSTVASSGSTTYLTRNYLVRINTDLTVDTTFDPRPNAPVQTLVIQSDQKIVLGGNFTTFLPNNATTTTARNYIARINTDGTVDTSVDLKSNSQIASLALQADNKIVVGGYFTSIANTARHYLARLNADLSLDTNFNPNPNSSVFIVTVQPDQKILIGGSFTALQPDSTSYDPAQSTPRNRAARINPDGTIDGTFNPNFDAGVGVLVSYPDSASSSSVIATGSFSTIQPAGALLVGGLFSEINKVKVNNVTLLGGDGSVSSTFVPNPNGTVYAVLQLANGRSVIGGTFTKMYGSTTRNHIARFTETNALDTSFDPNADGDVFALAVQADGKLIVGGAFNNIGGAPRANLARLNADGTADASFNATVSGAVQTVVVQTDGRILYTRATGGTTNVLGRLNADGSADGSFNAAHDGAVNAVAVQVDGKITVGGSFTTIGGGAQPYLARLTANGSLDTSITSKPSGAVTALALQPDGKVIIGGLFGSVDDLPRAGLARVSTSASGSESFSTNGARTAVVWNRSGALPEISGVLLETSTDTITWTQAGTGARISGTSNWQFSGLTLSDATKYFRTSAIMPVSPHGASGVIQSYGYVAPAAVAVPPVISSATVVSTIAGSSFVYTISASGSPTSFSATGLPAGLNFNSSTGVISGTPTQQGTYVIVLTATNSYGSHTTNLTLYVNAPGSTVDTGRVLNLSVNAKINSSNATVIAGFVISGTGSQNVLLRAVGPGLEKVGVTGVLAKPQLKLFKGGDVINSNSGWGGSDALVTEFARLGAFGLDANSADAALLVSLAPGPYTIHVTDLGTGGGTVLAEVYDALPNPPPANSPHLVNISARGVVTSSQLVTGGFVIGGNTSRQILIRGVGPGLTAQNVTGALANPSLKLNKIATGGVATVIARNDDWGTPVTESNTYPGATAAQISAAGASAGAFALAAGSADSAILVTLAPGVYTAEVSGTDSGAAMVEIYEIP